MLYDIALTRDGNVAVYGNGVRVKVVKTYAEAVDYIHSDEFARDCPVWTPMTISITIFSAVVLLGVLFGAFVA